MQLTSAQDEQASVLAMLSGRGGGANLRSGVQALLDEIRALESQLEELLARQGRDASALGARQERMETRVSATATDLAAVRAWEQPPKCRASGLDIGSVVLQVVRVLVYYSAQVEYR